jgi:hypothetical protein
MIAQVSESARFGRQEFERAHMGDFGTYAERADSLFDALYPGSAVYFPSEPNGDDTRLVKIQKVDKWKKRSDGNICS